MYQESGQTGWNAGIICNSNPGKENSATERKAQEATAEIILKNKQGAEGLNAANWNAASKAAAEEGCFSQSTGKQRLKSDLCRLGIVFQQKKPAD